MNQEEIESLMPSRQRVYFMRIKAKQFKKFLFIDFLCGDTFREVLFRIDFCASTDSVNSAKFYPKVICTYLIYEEEIKRT